MSDDEKSNWEIAKYNIATSEGYEVIGVVRGKSVAESRAESYTQKLSAEERNAGWTHITRFTTDAPTIQFPTPPKRKVDPFRKR